MHDSYTMNINFYDTCIVVPSLTLTVHQIQGNYVDKQIFIINK